MRGGARLPPSPSVTSSTVARSPRQLRVQLTQSVVRQDRQVDDRVVPLKRLLGDIADVHGKR